jgi:hypothetical protein
VWHCHILEHEDHAMMRPYTVTQASTAAISKDLIIVIVVLIVAVALAFIGLKIYRSRSARAG